MSHHSASQADLDVLAMITGENANNLGPLPGQSNGIGHQVQMKKKQMPRRDGPMESLMLSSVMSGAGSVSRHHFGHGAGELFIR